MSKKVKKLKTEIPREVNSSDYLLLTTLPKLSLIYQMFTYPKKDYPRKKHLVPRHPIVALSLYVKLVAGPRYIEFYKLCVSSELAEQLYIDTANWLKKYELSHYGKKYINRRVMPFHWFNYSPTSIKFEGQIINGVYAMRKKK